MKIIDKKNFFPCVCILYTIGSLFKIIFEGFLYDFMGKTELNLLTMFGISLIGTLILSQHYRFPNVPFGVIVVGQYILLISIIELSVWVRGHFILLHPDAYHDMFWSTTIPYILVALLYYRAVFKEVKRANQIIKKIKMNVEEQDAKKTEKP